MDKAKVIAFYLPQFHPFKENDEWWGPGFTEWTNLCKAKKLFINHEQPKIPGELGFYDLRLEQTRMDQAKLASEYGVDGFCYYYYRLNKDLRLMDQPIKEVLNTKKPNFPFMICWANHDWIAKEWNGDESFTSKLLAKQEYGSKEDNENYFYELLPYFKDERYMKEDNCPLFAIYKPLDVKHLEDFILLWNDLAKQNGFNGIKIWGCTENWFGEKERLSKYNLNKIISCKLQTVRNINSNFFIFGKIYRRLFKLPQILNYKYVIKGLVTEDEKNELLCPVMMPNWDPSPRRGSYCHLWINSTPELFYQLSKKTFDLIRMKNNKYVFIKSWNEWGEGNYMEPDRKWQRGYLESLKKARDEIGL